RPQGLRTGLEGEVFMEIRERELAERPIHRVTVSQDRVVRLRDRAPVPVLLEERDRVVFVAWRGIEIHEYRRPAVEGECGGCERRAFEAVCFTESEYHVRREAGLALLLMVYGEVIKEVLDARRRRKLPEHRAFRGRKSVHMVHHTILCSPNSVPVR